MANSKSAWGMEIGAYAIKAIRLEREGDQVRVSDFAVVPHKKVLTTPDMDQDEMIRLSLGQFISQKELEGEHLVMSVPGHAAFARFAKLPPVEAKKVPDIVRFEAVQQIPFPIDEVEWDYQTFTSDDTPEIEVGIFAITRERVQQRLGLYAELGISPESLTLSPIAVYNAMSFDHALKKDGPPVIYLDIGTSATDLIVAHGGRCWVRTFPLGGTHFTDAIASSFKLSYSKAEKLKEEASTSKYAKQIMQAMRPVFSDLLQDVQRSIGYYQSLHREAELTTMIGLGSTFKIPGLRKFLGQQLQINVLRLDEYKKISVPGREAASFAENAVNMATAYGLALQGVGMAPIDANLVPVKALRDQVWRVKTKWFAAAAAIVVAGAAMTLWRPMVERGSLNPGGLPREVDDAISRGERIKAEFASATQESQVGAMATNVLQLVDYRKVWPFLVDDAAAALSSVKPQPELLDDDLEAIIALKPELRRFVQLRHLSGQYLGAGADGKSRRIAVTMEVEFSNQGKNEFLNGTVAKWLRDHAEPTGDRADVPYRIIAGDVSINATSLQTVRVDENGVEVASGGTPSGAPAQPSAPRAPRGGAAPGGGEKQAPPAGPTGPGRGGGARGAKNKGPEKQYQTPGENLGAGAAGQQPGTPPVKPGQDEGESPGTPIGPVNPGAPPVPADIEAKAPVPPQPPVYPPGSTFYRLPITFTIELIGPTGTGALESPASPEEEEVEEP